MFGSAKRILSGVLGLLRDTQGQDLIEYALITGAAALACFAVLPELTLSTSALFERAGALLVAAGGTVTPGVQ